jgi:hypothetical protein
MTRTRMSRRTMLKGASALGALVAASGGGLRLRIARPEPATILMLFPPSARPARSLPLPPAGSHQVVWRTYSITSSARASSVGGTSRPRAFAVLRLITSSYLVGACTGRSAGFSPLRMRST